MLYPPLILMQGGCFQSPEAYKTLNHDTLQPSSCEVALQVPEELSPKVLETQIHL